MQSIGANVQIYNRPRVSGSTSIDASRLIFQSAVFFKNRLDAKKQAGPTSLFFGIQAVKTSEFIERTLQNPRSIQWRRVGTCSHDSSRKSIPL